MNGPFLACLWLLGGVPLDPDAIDFVRDVRPILEQRCHGCHGERRQKGGLRLDRREDALRGGDSGRAIIPGRPDESLLIDLVDGGFADLVMPPKGKPLDAADVDVLRRWIAEGPVWPDRDAEGHAHWSLIPPVRPEPPALVDDQWSRNDIDRFVLAAMRERGLEPSPEADRLALIRRVSLDLIGLPPTPEEADAFVADDRPDAYERLVERLLASPHYGERWALRWLDLARYSDTNGFEKDRPRDIWLWRDWVIDALNRDLPFDQFTTEQLAGDLLPDATLDQRIATGFHRNTMLNEEGGVDSEEFRYYSVIDRVDTTATVWLGLTMGCARCHDHKFDPFSQRDYYQLFDFLNQDDEPLLTVPDPEIEVQRQQALAEIAAARAELPEQWPLPLEVEWEALAFDVLAAEPGIEFEVLDDGSVLVSGENPAKALYTLSGKASLDGVTSVRVEALAHESLPSNGPGRTAHGNFVLSEFSIATKDAEGQELVLPLREANADFSQDGYPVAHAIDGNRSSGWAIHGPGDWNVDRTATFRVDVPAGLTGTRELLFALDQQYGAQHTVGRSRISLGRERGAPDGSTTVERRQELVNRRFDEWTDEVAARASEWYPLHLHREWTQNGTILEQAEDRSILARGDVPNRDTYVMWLDVPAAEVTGLRLEALPHESLPENGPGRAPLFAPGDFLLSEIRVYSADDAPREVHGSVERQGWRPAELVSATHSYAADGRPAALATDGDLDTGWSVKGRVGEAHQAVFSFARPLKVPFEGVLVVELVHHYIHQTTLGRFRISATCAPEPVAAGVPAEIEKTLLRSPDTWTLAERNLLLDHFLWTTPELESARQPIRARMKTVPRHPTTMVLAKRPRWRRTYLHGRGEYTSPGECVGADVPSVLHPWPEGERKDRLGLARWLVDPDNALLGRVVVNRHWQTLFGRGLVTTPEDFGTQGARPTHPALLDWLAVEFVESGHGMKELHRRIVTSATYRQSSVVQPETLAKDPDNGWLARGPRLRLEAELVRDAALAASGLLNPEIGGPSVFPPQPPGVTDLSYGALAWKTSAGKDRHRRGLYTYSKRTTPYAAFALFDAPSGETTCVRRSRSNTPLQALTLLNDAVYVEAARALARRVIAERDTDRERATRAFRLCLTRRPSDDELAMLVDFADRQRQRLANDLDAARDLAAPPPDSTEDVAEVAAWTALARVLLNLDEMITRG